jgi:hypothetical protein
MLHKPSRSYLLTLTALAALFPLSRAALADAGDSTATLADFQKPAWLSDLSFGAKESYDDNVLLVSGLGMPVQNSWVDDFIGKVGFNFVPLLPPGGDITVLSLVYSVDRASYTQAHSEDNTQNKLNGLFKGKVDNFSWSLDEAFLYVDGNKQAPTYAENQLGATAAGSNQNDKYRNNYAHAVARERRDQVQDRDTIFVQYDVGNVFVRPIEQTTYYNMLTNVYNTSNAPYKGYQDYIDRWDINYGADLGLKVIPGLAFTLGYRDGYQHQDGYSAAINSDTHQASNHYQRLLFGVEGKVSSWLTLKAAAGPDFKVYNPDTPITHDTTTRYYGEGVATFTLPDNQSISLNYKQWFWVSSTGLVPYEDTTVGITYHIALSPQWGLDVGGRYLDANYTLSNDYAGSAPGQRDDGDFGGNVALTYSVTKQLTIGLAYNYDKGENLLNTLPAKLFGGYRNFSHSVYALNVNYKF